jgi:hypothetical protein
MGDDDIVEEEDQSKQPSNVDQMMF